MKLRQILVPLDGSDLAERALPLAEQLARRAGATLVLARAPLARVFSRMDAIDANEAESNVVAEAEKYLQAVRQRLAEHGLRCRTATPRGEADESGLAVGQTVRPSLPFRQLAEVSREAAAAVAHEAESRRVDLIVMATHGRSGLGRWVYGSVTLELLHRATVPVLLVRSGAPDTLPEGDGLRVLVPLDGSPLAEMALSSALSLADLLGGSLVLIQVIPAFQASRVGWLIGPLVTDPSEHAALDAAAHTYLEAIRKTLEDQTVPVDLMVEEGDPALAVARAAKTKACALVAVATHGRTGLARLAIGSVAEGIVATAPAAVLVVRSVGVEKEWRVMPAEAEVEPKAPEPRPLAMTLSQAERDLVRTSLQALRQTVSRDEHLSEPIHRLLDRLDETERSIR